MWLVSGWNAANSTTRSPASVVATSEVGANQGSCGSFLLLVWSHIKSGDIAETHFVTSCGEDFEA